MMLTLLIIFPLDSSTGSSEGVHDTEITDAGNKVLYFGCFNKKNTQ